jgi:prepilin-type N-terminal cleavage/methylation domain-containing protein
MNFLIFKAKDGFTLLEITVVVFVIVLGMTGVLSLVNQNIQVEYVNKNMVIASQLAQEGLELVRNKRDINWLNEENWEYSSTIGSAFDIIQDGSYAIDYTGAINSAPNSVSDVGAKLYIDTSGFYASAVTDVPTMFSRLITVGNENAASTTVTCLVQWKRGTNTYNFSAQTLLWDWR